MIFFLGDTRFALAPSVVAENFGEKVDAEKAALLQPSVAVTISAMAVLPNTFFIKPPPDELSSIVKLPRQAAISNT